MVETEEQKRKLAESNAPAKELLVRAYKLMLIARLTDEKMSSLYKTGKIHGGVFLGKGQEALSVSLGLSLRKGDVFAPLIRDGAGRLAFGESLEDAIRTYLGSALGPMKGRDGNVHRGRPTQGMLPMISHLGAMVSVVNGVLFAHRMQGVRGTVGATCLGDGATSTGAFHEGLNQAAVEKLPLVLIVANNQFAYSTPNERQFACKSLIDKAAGYGVTGHQADGTDLCDCMAKVGGAVEAARAGNGPQLIVANLLRLCGHGEHDDASYITAELKNCSLGRDNLNMAAETLIRLKCATENDLQQWRSEAIEQIDAVVAQVQREAAPDPYREEWSALSTAELSEGAEQMVAQ